MQKYGIISVHAIIINNHFRQDMDIENQLNNELLTQDFPPTPEQQSELDMYKKIARHYAMIENAIAVLSDMRSNTSYLYYGGFSQTLGIRPQEMTGKVYSIWEENLLKRIHPDDLHDKYLQELRFFHFVKQQPKNKRNDFFLISKIRMADASNSYLPVLHRMFYISISSATHSLWLALCLYNPLHAEIPGNGAIINSTTGQITELKRDCDTKILSEREKQVLKLIDQGMMSKHIAGMLSISKNTVNRHRQQILRKLQVKNSIEACRIAKELKII